MYLSPSELILNPDGSIYHLKLFPSEIAQTIITVGDPERIDMLTTHFESIEFDRRCREFRTVTGSYQQKRITVISTGIGTDNIDIVFNELDALVNIDFESRAIKKTHTSLQFIRIGTSGTLQADIPVDSLLVSSFAIGLGGLAHYYLYTMNDREKAINSRFKENWSNHHQVFPYCAQAEESLVERFTAAGFMRGITLTAPGFYAPQGRSLRLKTSVTDLDGLAKVEMPEDRLTNLEMETAGIYLLANLLGHQAISCNALLANRVNGEFSKAPAKAVEALIEKVLKLI